jgi:hypothetical protein
MEKNIDFWFCGSLLHLINLRRQFCDLQSGGMGWNGVLDGTIQIQKPAPYAESNRACGLNRRRAEADIINRCRAQDGQAG